MNEFRNYYKAKDLKGNWVTGYYACLPYTTYCFKEDYNAHPDNDKHYLITTRMIDWGLPNQVVLQEIDPLTLCRYVGADKNGEYIFEGDKVQGASRDKHLPQLMQVIVYGNDWEASDNTVFHTRYKLRLNECIKQGSIWEDK